MTVWGWVGECGGSKPPFWKKIAYGEGAKKSKKKTNNSAFSATHTCIKLTLVTFFSSFFCAPSPNLIIYCKVLVLVNFLNFPNLKYMQSNNPIWPFLEYQPWGAGYSDVQVVHLDMGKLYQRGEARKMSRWYRQKDITIKMISPKRYYYRQKDIIIGDSEQGDPSSSEANWKEVTLESREYFLMKDGQGVMDRWTDLLWSIIIMNSSLLMQRFFIMVVRSLFVHLQRNSAKVIQM